MRQFIDLVTPLMENDYGQGQPLDQLPAYVAKHVLEADNLIEWCTFTAHVLNLMGDNVDDEYVASAYHETLEWARDPENRSEFEATFEAALREVVQTIKQTIGTNPTLHRIMKVNSDYPKAFLINQKITMGIYWTYDRDSTEDFLQFSGPNNGLAHEVIVSATVPTSSIDWAHTLLCFAEYRDFEKEVRLIKGAPLTITNMTMDNQEIDTRGFQAKTVA